ncbi:unnamed protein product [Phytophthora lilii]|uniref:Unnamed protein product n=1 Tax=Phytophthora lilii TaxID=2077276 RepID=A0A9W6U7I3_9STRA|nr:unnamed protein product [Phytophthora lilii]
MGREHTAVKSSLSQPAGSPGEEKQVHPQPAEPRPPPAAAESKVSEKLTPDEKKKQEKQVATTPVQVQDEAASTDAVAPPKVVAGAERLEEELDPLFQSRMFDAKEFQTTDFVTVFDRLAVARRSHPPPPKPATVPLNMATSTSMRPAAATVSSGPNANDLTRPSTVATPHTSASASITTEAAPTTKPGATVVSQSAPPSTTTTSTSVSTPVAPSVNAPRVISKSPTGSAAPANLPLPTKTSIPAVTPPTIVPSASAAVPPPAKVPSKPTQQRSTPRGSATSTPMASVSTAVKTAPVPSQALPSATLPKPSQSAAMKPMSRVEATAILKATPTVTGADPALATKALSRPATSQGGAQVHGNINTLLPKKKHSEGAQGAAKERHTKPPPVDTYSSDADGVVFLKVNAPPVEIIREVPAETPALGFCSFEFLAFMRECGGDEVDEEEDPEAVSLSQLRLLNVVDLTNLSDSEDMDSDAESPLPTPRAGVASAVVPSQGVTANGLLAGSGRAPTAAAPNVSGKGTWYVPTLDSEPRRARPEKVMCELCEETGLPARLIRCPTCTKYYHKKCARENGDENICWNCELGSMIDDSELDAEHAKHDSEYLAYLRAIRGASSPGSHDDEEDEEEDDDESVEEEEGGAADDGDAEVVGPDDSGEKNNPFSEESSANNPGRRWKEFIGGATADVDAAYHEVTNRIAEELRDEEKRRFYSRGFVSREEFEAQMTEVEEYYITEEARLQQLEREKAVEARKAAEARKAKEAAELAAANAATNDNQAVGSGTIEANPPVLPTAIAPNGSNSGGVINSAAPSSAPIAPASSAPLTNTPVFAATSVTAIRAPTAGLTPPTIPVPTAAFVAAFRAAFAARAPLPPSKP